MSRRDFIRDLIAGKSVNRCGLWIGNPQMKTVEILNKASGTKGEEALHQYFNDDVRWITPHYIKSTYSDPSGISMRHWKDTNPHGIAGGILAKAETIEEIDSLNWPDLQFLNFDETINKLKQTGDFYRLSGFWSPFYHDLTYLFGTEELLTRLFTHAPLIHRALEHLCGFYLQANELFYDESKGLIDAMFFGNDFGSQNDLLIAPDQFEEFFLPWIKKFSQQAHDYKLQVVLHSCGSIYRILNQLINAGVDAIHPIQSKAANMDAEYLSKNFKGKVAFIGGIDAQGILTFGSPQEVYNEVIRVKTLLGNNIILGPSHEVLMPNVPYENVKAMCEAVKEEIII